MIKSTIVTCLVLSLNVLSAGRPLTAREIQTSGLQRHAWAPRLSGGPIRAVFLASYVAAQDSFELTQRFDIDGIVVPVSGVFSGHYWPDLLSTPEQVESEVRQALKSDWEVVVTTSWSIYPEDIRTAILSAVGSGRALMIRTLEDGLKADLRGTGLQLTETDIGATRFSSADDGDAVRKIYRCGQGYIAHFHVPDGLGDGYLLGGSVGQCDFELSAGRAGWFLRQIARPQTEPLLSSLSVDEGTVVIEAVSNPALAGFILQIVIRRCDTYEVVFASTRQAEPSIRIASRLPQLPGGEYQAEVIALDDQGNTLDWEAVRFTLAGQIEVKAITVEDHVVGAGEQVTCHLEVAGPTERLRMVSRWFDHWNRLLLKTNAVAFSDQLTVTAPAGSLSVLNHLEITLSSDRGPEAIVTAEILMPANIRPTDFYVLYWNHGRNLGSSWRQRLQYDALRRRGAADAFSNCGTEASYARNAALAHMRTVPYTTSFHYAAPPDVFSEDRLAKTEQGARKCAQAQKPYNPLAYTLGDENFLNGSKPEGRLWDAPEAWEMFQSYLRELYPDVESLNTQWGTSFSSWEEGRFNSERQMLGSLDNPSAWVDYRMFFSRGFAGAHQRMRMAIQQEDPGAIVGWDGCEQFSSYGGYDWWQMTRNMDLLNVYHHTLVPSTYVRSNRIFNGEAVGSFRPEASLRGCWMNEADGHYGGHYVPWYLCLKSRNSVWWWYASRPHPSNGALRWDLSLTPIAEAMAAASHEIKRGPATLIAHAEQIVDPIAIHYSENNFIASTIESGVDDFTGKMGGLDGLDYAFWNVPGLVSEQMSEQMRELWGGITVKGHYAAASKNFYLLLHDLGFQPRTVARQQIEAGILDTGGVKALILPFVVSLSDIEVARIHDFVENGGLLIADYRCAVRDLHGKLRQTPALDDIFGIVRNSTEVRWGRAPVMTAYKLGTQYRTRFEATFRESLGSTGAESFARHDDDTAAFFINHYGQGQAVYLNTDLYAYEQMRRRGTERDLRDLFRRILMDLAKLSPTFVPQHEYGHPLSHTEVTRFRDGDTSYFGVLPDFGVDDKSPVTARLPFPETMHIYDVRRHAYLGKGGAFKRTLTPGRPEMYAAIPYQVLGVTVSCENTARRGESVQIELAINADTAHPGPHAARVKVVYPDGTEPEYLTRTVYLPHGRASLSFVPALNAPAGPWQVDVFECVSGKKAQEKIQVK